LLLAHIPFSPSTTTHVMNDVPTSAIRTSAKTKYTFLEQRGEKSVSRREVEKDVDHDLKKAWKFLSHACAETTTTSGAHGT
jgi:hypothetical protein